MTPEIKQRIEQIRRGEVPEGYRYIRNSICPIDWTMKRVGDCIEEYREISNDIQSFPVYSSSRKGLVLQSEYYDQKKTEETNLGYKIVPNGYVTYRHMSDDDVFHFNINQTGGAILVSSEYPVFTSANGVAIGFLIPALNDTVRFRYFCRTQKLGGTRTRLYLKNLSQYRLSVPCFQEQQKIAAILTTQDKVIELKEKRLAEKQRQKKYLMQQLLTGKKRLPGFSKSWQTVELGEIFNYIQPTAYLVKTTDYDDSYKTPVLTAGKTFILGYTNELEGIFTEVPVVIFDDFTTATKYVDFPFKVKSSAMKILTTKDGFNIVFAYEAMQLIKFTVGGHERHWISKYNCLTIDIPDIEEQTAIAEVLTAAGREMELLRQEIEQEKQKKKALMQLLLTGIVRVNV